MLRREWPPLGGATDEECARPAERIATLLGSNAPLRALASELGRIRGAELDAPPDADADRFAAEAILGWFEARAAAVPDAPAQGSDS